MLRPRFGIVALLAVGALLSCSDDGGPIGPDSGETSATIGPAGGTVALGDRVSVTVPPGALSEEVTIRIETSATPAALADQGALGQAFRFRPEGLAFAAPVEISLFVPDDALAGLEPEALALLTTAATPAGFERLTDLRHEAATGGIRVQGRTTHFSVISAAAPPNEPPALALGEDRDVAIGSAVSVSASATDPDGDAVSIAWSLESRPAGSAADLSNGSGPETGFVADVAGDFVVLATASDGRGGTASATVTITAKSGPVADAGPDQTVPVDTSVTLDGSGSAGSNLSFSWRFLSTPGSAPSIQDADQTTARFTPGQTGTYVVELTVSDGSLSDEDTVTITVTRANRAPTVELVAGADFVFLGTEVFADATAEDRDGDPLTFTWSLQGPAGSTASLSISGRTARLVPDVPGEYHIEVTVSDGLATASAAVTIAGNPNVAGDYDTTFEVTSASGCQGFVSEDQETAVMPVEQPSAGVVVLDLPSVSSNVKSTPVGTYTGTFFRFEGTITVGDDSQQVNATGRISGPITPDGSLDLTFRFRAFSCIVEGTIVGTKL